MVMNMITRNASTSLIKSFSIIGEILDSCFDNLNYQYIYIHTHTHTRTSHGRSQGSVDRNVEHSLQFFSLNLTPHQTLHLCQIITN